MKSGGSSKVLLNQDSMKSDVSSININHIIEQRDSSKGLEVMNEGLKERLEFLQKNNLLLNDKLNKIESSKQDLKLK